MKRTNIAIFLLIAIIVAMLVFTAQRNYFSSLPAKSSASSVKMADNRTAPVGHYAPTPSLTSGPSSQNSSAEIEHQSLQNMVSVLASFATPGRSLEELVDYLKSAKQDPAILEDKNEYTGSMYIVRTNSPLPGTRYFHAQYFKTEEGTKFVQHMSFEYKPGPQAMAQALQTVQQAFKLGPPNQKTASFAAWNLNDGYTLWIKKQSAADLENNDLNPSTDADIGSIRIAIEQNPHDDIDGHDH